MVFKDIVLYFVLVFIMIYSMVFLCVFLFDVHGCSKFDKTNDGFFLFLFLFPAYK